MTTEQELRDAAQLLRDYGWVQGAYQEDGALCMTAACAIARGAPLGAGPSPSAYRHLVAVTGCRVVPLFNDDHCRTRNDAIAALEIAADLAS